MIRLRRWPEIALAISLLCAVVWLRWPTFGFTLWNVDEAIHAAAARTILDGGVLYRDAIDQRTPFSYYAIAAIFALCGENNLWAVRCAIAGLIAATGFLLYLAGGRLQGQIAGLIAAALYALLSSSVFYPADAYAANTEWFVAFFTSAAAALFLSGTTPVNGRTIFLSGLLLGCAFLSKQPALLDLAAPGATLLYAAWRQNLSRRTLVFQGLTLVAGWLVPVLMTLGYFAARGALRDGIFYTWTYNLTYYGPEISLAERLGSLAVPFRQLGTAQPWLLGLWSVGALLTLHRLVQRQPAPAECATNPGLLYLGVWSLSALGGAAASGRGFEHYFIQFLPPLCLGASLGLARLLTCVGQPGTVWSRRLAAAALVAIVTRDLALAVQPARQRLLPADPSVRASAYIREHTKPADRIFVWGYHPDIYLYTNRRPASRFLYASFITGLIPWTNTAPERDTGYAIVPGAMDQLLQDLASQPPVFIVDCSAGPNRYWQKYPLEKFPALRDYIRHHYRVVEAGQFVPQGFRLFQRRAPGESTPATGSLSELPAEVLSTLALSTVGTGLKPFRASAPNGTNVSMVEGRLEYFAHAPSQIVYQLPAGATALRGGFGLKPGAYAPTNAGATDGAEFVIRWRPVGGNDQILFQRHLRPREEITDRGIQSFRVELPTNRTGGQLELVITPGPAENLASDWTYWTDLTLERFL